MHAPVASPACNSPSLAVHLFQELLGHTDVRTTMIYTHLLNRASPPRSYNGAMPIGIARRPCAVDSVDKSMKQSENNTKIYSLHRRGMPVSILNSWTASPIGSECKSHHEKRSLARTSV